jgi:hypothetical protein
MISNLVTLNLGEEIQVGDYKLSFFQLHLINAFLAHKIYGIAQHRQLHLLLGLSGG